MREKESKYRRILPALGSRAPVLARERTVPAEHGIQTILEAVTEGYWRWNLGTGEVYLGGEWLASLGYAPGDLPKDEVSFKSFIHGDDLARFESGFDSHVAGVAASLDCECRLWLRTGELKWFRIRGKITRRDKSGRPSIMAGAILDIHAQKSAQEEMRASGAQLLASFERTVEALRESEERLRIAIESGPMYACEWDPVSDEVRRSEKSAGILALPPDSHPTLSEFIEGVHPDDREYYSKVIRSLTLESPSYKLTFRFVRRDQKTIWLEESGRAIFEPTGKIRKIVAMTADVTDARQSERALRELSGRLISSQEEERRRIARELHDHIGQELALLCVQAQRVDSGVSDEEHTTPTDVHELYRRIKEIAVDVSKLSHRLHSSELDFLGLSVAAERLCHDFASQYNIDVDYQIKNVPRLDSGKSLCFYRVLQEALQNVAKHSHATRVDVELRRIGSELVLRIIDNGGGFDMERVRFASGLGLVSIRERLKLIGGRLELHSEEGRGTRLVATVGIPSAD